MDWFHFSILTWTIISVLFLITCIYFDKLTKEKVIGKTIKPMIVSIILIVFVVGIRFITKQPTIDPGSVAWYNDTNQRVTLTGTVESLPDERDNYTNLRVNITIISTGETEKQVDGIALVKVPPNVTYLAGDRLRFQGYLRTPPTDIGFDYKEYLARQGILSQVTAIDIQHLPYQNSSPFTRVTSLLRVTLLNKIKVIFPEPEGSLLAGILLGADKGITKSLQDAFRNTGTSHIIAISGFNITILAALFITIFKRVLGRWKGAATSILAIIFYTLLVGADAAVVRAAVMGCTAIVASQLGRKQNGLNILGFAVFVMCVIDPSIPWDVGFQLSFAATLGLILYAQPMQERMIKWLSKKLPEEKAQKWSEPIAEYILFTFAAQLTTLPVIAYHFGQISIISFLVNPLILPAQPPVMVASGLAVLAGTVYLPLGKILAWLAWPFSMYTIRIVELFNKIPKGTIYLGEFSFLFVLIFYLVLFGITFIPKSLKETIRSQIKPSILIGVLVLSTILVWKAVITLPDGKLHVNFFNVENGNAILIQTASGKNLLINGGSSRSELSDALGRRLSPFDRHLDALIIASTLDKQLTALPGIIQQYPPDLVLWSGLTALSDSATQLRRDLETSGIPIIQSDTGMVMDLGDGAFLDILTVNSHGMVLMLKWNEFTALLPIEMDFDNLSNLVKDPELDNVSLYLVSSSGYSPLNPIEWIEKLNTNLGILTVSSSDSLLLPDQETMVALEPYPILRTDYNGWIKVSTDGNQIWVESER